MDRSETHQANNNSGGREATTPLPLDLDLAAPVCCDCAIDEGVVWFSCTTGVLLCHRCASVHQSLGEHVSSVMHQDVLAATPSLLSMATLVASGDMNGVWEATLGKSEATQAQRPTPATPTDALARFISAKYRDRAYLPPATDQHLLQAALERAVLAVDVVEAFKCCVLGADVTRPPTTAQADEEAAYLNTTLLHLAAASGEKSLCEVLLCHGADATATDMHGMRPHEVARFNGFLKCSARLMQVALQPLSTLALFLTDNPMWWGSKDDAVATIPNAPLLPSLRSTLEDVCSEIRRRNFHALWMQATLSHSHVRDASVPVPFLPVCAQFPPLRQQARQKLGLFGEDTLSSLIYVCLYHTIVLAWTATPTFSAEERESVDQLILQLSAAELGEPYAGERNAVWAGTEHEGDTTSAVASRGGLSDVAAANSDCALIQQLHDLVSRLDGANDSLLGLDTPHQPDESHGDLLNSTVGSFVGNHDDGASHQRTMSVKSAIDTNTTLLARQDSVSSSSVSHAATIQAPASNSATLGNQIMRLLIQKITQQENEIRDLHAKVAWLTEARERRSSRAAFGDSADGGVSAEGQRSRHRSRGSSRQRSHRENSERRHHRDSHKAGSRSSPLQQRRGKASDADEAVQRRRGSRRGRRLRNGSGNNSNVFVDDEDEQRQRLSQQERWWSIASSDDELVSVADFPFPAQQAHGDGSKSGHMKQPMSRSRESSRRRQRQREQSRERSKATTNGGAVPKPIKAKSSRGGKDKTQKDRERRQSARMPSTTEDASLGDDDSDEHVEWL